MSEINKNHPLTEETPWFDEPDFLYWIEDGKYYCIIWRSPIIGCLCGYCSVPKDSILYKAKYIDGKTFDFDVHGGITFSGFMKEAPLPEVANKEWFIGFDCAHAEDLFPYRPDISHLRYLNPQIYRDINYVKAEVESLCNQIKNYEGLEKNDHPRRLR